MSIAQKTLKGIFWVYASFFGGRVLTLVSTAILARLLIPEDFGIIGFALIFLAFIEAARSFGVNDALIYTSEKVEEAADTVFIINIVLAVGQFILAFLFAPLLVNFFDDPRIVEVVRIMSLTFILDGLGQTHDALLQKELEFRRRFMPELLAAIVKGVFSIIFALAGLGIWSLVLGNLIGAASRTVAKWWVLRWRPRLRFYMDRARALWQYGMHILMFNVLGIALDQADQLLIGVLLGQLQLGYYAIAMKLPEMVIANFSLMLTRVLFPAYAKMKSDIGQLTEGFKATTRYTAYVTIPLGLGMAAVAPELVLIAFGDQWGPAVPLLQVLALMGAVSTLAWSAGDILKAIGRPDISTKILVVEALYTFPLIYIMVSRTELAIMAAVANLISLTIAVIIRLLVIMRFLDVKVLDFYQIFRSPFFAGGMMFVGVTAWRYLLADLPALLVLASSVLVGALIYVALMWLVERQAIQEASQTILDTLRRRKSDDDDDEEDDDENGDEEDIRATADLPIVIASELDRPEHLT